ncbi:MAG: hypothetical protein AAF487_04140 [Bacteroidota bacterium]
MLTPLTALSQTEVHVNSSLGHENNINFSPDFIVEDGEIIERQELYANSLFNDLRLAIKTEKKWAKSVFRIEGKQSKRSYFNAAEYNQSQRDLESYFSYSFSKNSTFRLGLDYTSKDRLGLDFDASEFALPLGYRKFTVNPGFDFRLSKKNRTAIDFVAGRKTFNETDVRESSYTITRISISSKKVQWKNHILRVTGFKGAYTLRNYNFFYFEEDSVRIRPLTYLDLGIFSKHQLNKKWTLSSSLDFQKRFDNEESRFGYTQLKPNLTLVFRGKSRFFKIKPAYVFRRFDSSLMANSDAAPDRLQFDYFKLSFYLSQQLSNQFSLFAKGNFTDRRSNNLNEEMFIYRSYENWYAGIGIKWKYQIGKKDTLGKK